MIEKVIVGAAFVLFLWLFVKSVRKPKPELPKRGYAGTSENENSGNELPIGRNDGRKPELPTAGE